MNAAEATKNEALPWAKITSSIFHPWAVLVPVLALTAYQAVGGSPEWIKWTLLAYIPAIAFPSLSVPVI